jgi:hypothetical protein
MMVDQTIARITSQGQTSVCRADDGRHASRLHPEGESKPEPFRLTSPDELSFLLARAVMRRDGSGREQHHPPHGPILARAVGYELQMLKSKVDGKAKLPYRGGNGWSLVDDSGNLEFVVSETNSSVEMSKRITAATQFAQALITGNDEEVKGKQPKNALANIRAHTTFENDTAQPQINADVRLDQLNTFFFIVDSAFPPRHSRHGPGDPDAAMMFSNRSSFKSWKKTKPEYEDASARFIALPYSALVRMVKPNDPRDAGFEVAKLRGLLRLMFQYLIHGKKQFMPPQDFMKDIAFLSKSNMGLAAKQILFAENYCDDKGQIVGPVHELITDMLTIMAGRQRDERVFHGMNDTPKIETWVEVIVREGDDPLASLEKAVSGRRFASERVNFPTSLGGLGLAKTKGTGPTRASGRPPAQVPELVVEFRRIPEISVDEWVAFAERWFEFFEGVRTELRVQDTDADSLL